MGKNTPLICAAIFTFIGCAHTPPKPPAPPPTTTQDTCVQIRTFFSDYGGFSDYPDDMKAGCHMHLAPERNVGSRLTKFLEQSGWHRNTAVEKDGAAVWETPSTRCIIGEFRHGGPNVGFSAGGGTHMGSFFGLGIGVGTGDRPLDYQVDCVPRPVPK